MQVDQIVSPAVRDDFARSREEWKEALDSAMDDRDAILRLAQDIQLGTDVSAVDKRELTKYAAKLLGTTYGTLRKDVQLDAVPLEPKRDHLSLAREAVEGFGDQGFIFAKGDFWRWDARGVWRTAEEQEVRKCAIDVIESEEPVTDGIVRSVVALMKDIAHSSGTLFDVPVSRRINCANGTLEYLDGAWTLREHRQEDYLTSQVPVPYSHAATCPRFTRFLAEVFEGDDDASDKAQAVLEMLGYSLLQSCRFEKFAILVGKGSNGKSVLLEVLRHLAGPDQVAAVEPARMGDRFQRGHLRGKLVNIVPELPVGSMLADAAVKSFVSGDPVNGEFKGGQPFDYTPYATIWLGTNHMPHTRDLSDGMFRRALILKFNRKFSETDRELGLADKLQKELPGIFVAALEALGNAFERGHITVPPSSNDALKEWRKDSDQVAIFLEECCTLDAGVGPTPVGELFEAYKDWAQSENHRHTVTGKAFGQRLIDLGLQGCKSYVGGRQVRCYFGIDLMSRTS